MLQTGTDFAIHIRDNRAPFPAIVVFPQAKSGTRWFYPEMQELVMAELDRTIAEFSVDTTRLYLHGYSMGATGSYRLAYKFPDRFAAVVIVAGRVEPGVNYTPDEIAVDRATNPVVANSDPFSALATGLRKIPMWIFHGDADLIRRGSAFQPCGIANSDVHCLTRALERTFLRSAPHHIAIPLACIDLPADRPIDSEKRWGCADEYRCFSPRPTDQTRVSRPETCIDAP